MTDETQNPDQPKENASFSLEELTAAMNAEFDKRFQGFQSLLDRRTSEFQRELAELKTADLSPEEQEQFETRKRDEEIAALRRENELLQMRREFPEEVDLLEDFFKKSSLQDQLELLSAFRKAQAEEAPSGDTDAQPTPVDKNSNPRKPTLTLSDVEGGNMTNDLADKVIESVGNEKGILRRLTGR
jgi:hypothetical protein